ncbi:EEF1A lysine methyltransferase 1-like [Paramacrobiotus metropolitanus]|uniref:EEF1A lysine methyltransferase 1-like n=1 Tax=Paramacrobiotus metropolitanus TaxID=2943436 RepID=UPI002445E8CF|nr:EEF1A lysine methyltransferase 1-like [Paramacrobiotus metropolitanus]
MSASTVEHTDKPFDNDHDDDDPPALSEETLRALAEFRREQETGLLSGTDSLPVSENWQLSQFWYDESTCQMLAREVWESTEPGEAICCISCPSLFAALLKFHGHDSVALRDREMVLLEYDDRFRITAGDKFVFYDYNLPDDIPSQLMGKFAFIAADPPFLSEECLEKVSLAVRKLAKPECKVLLCTGEIMEDTAAKLLSVKKCRYSPVHKSKLSNSFATFTNYDPSVLDNL